MMNKNEKWLKILAEDKNFNQEDLNKIILDSCYSLKNYKNKIESELMTYRNQLLQQMNRPNFNEKMTKENLQKWFLEPINEQKFDYIKEDMKTNYWTIEELWDKCKEESIGILSASNLMNPNIKFYDGMRIYNVKGQTVNILNSTDAKKINFIRSEINLKELIASLKDTTVPIALGKQIHRIRTDRMANATDFTLSKTNVQFLSAELYSDTVYNMLVEAMQINNWSLKELVQESLRLDMNLFMISGVPNRVMA